MMKRAVLIACPVMVKPGSLHAGKPDTKIITEIPVKFERNV